MDQRPVSQNYSCTWAVFAERHYAKVFSKRYKSAWQTTRNDITDICRRIDSMLAYKRADLIYDNGLHKLVKLDFAVASTRVSPKAAGNRCVLYINEETRHVEVLLAYSKNEIGLPNETAKWKGVVRKEYCEIAKIFSL